MSKDPLLIITIRSKSQNGWGGDDSVLVSLVRNWPKEGANVTVGLNEGHPCLSLYRRVLPAECRVIQLQEKTIDDRRTSSWLSVLLDVARPVDFIWGVLRIYKLIRELHPSALLLSSGGYPVCAISFRTLCAAALLRVPRVVLLVHGHPLQHPDGFKSRLLSIFAKMTPLLCHQLIAPSESCARALERVITSVRTPVRINNGLDERRDSPLFRSDLGVSGEGPLVGCVANLQPGKGLEFFIEAIARVVSSVPKTRAIIIGSPVDGDYEDFLQEKIESEGLVGKVILRGFLPDAGRAMAAFDVCVVPSSALEVFPMTALEAMKWGRPIVATRIGGIPEMIRDGLTGILVAPGNSREMAEAIEKLLLTPELAERLGAAAHKDFLSRFSARIMSIRYRAVLAG